MADLDLNDELVVLGGVKADPGFTHDNVDVTLTATMKQGSILGSDGAELAVASAASAYYVIDDVHMSRWLDEYETGDSLTVSVAARGLILNEDACVFSDDAIDDTGKAALEAYNNKFSTITVDSTL